VRVALLLLARAARLQLGELALGEPAEHRLQLRGVGERLHALHPRAQLPQRLRPAQHQHCEHGLLVAGEAGLLVEQVSVLGRAGA
jgi:hypothetical protein